MMKKLIIAFCFLGATAFAQANSPYMAKVYDFMPAPGQYVNVMPEYKPGDTKETMIKKVQEQLCCDPSDAEMISLGAYGGYLVFGFDHTVVNIDNEYDMKIYGNAFAAQGSTTGGSSEPGIVMVSYDANHNGIPDDAWFELAGSEYYKNTTKYNYTITYYRTPAGHVADPDPNNKAIIDRKYVRWTTNYADEAEGYVMKNTYHAQNYFPEWITDDVITFTGSKLRNNGHDTSGTGQYFVLDFFDWGYVDNLPNKDEPGLKIEWAVDENGVPVYLPGVDFVKVYTALNQYCGWLGETSTEVAGAEDLHHTATPTEFKIGDSNNDGTVDIADIVNLTNYACKQGVTTVNYTASDANVDTKVDAKDAAEVASIILKK